MSRTSVTIGVTSPLARDIEATGSLLQHAKWIGRFGGTATILPCELDSIERFKSERLDGLLLTGGGDVAPGLYGGRTELAQDVNPLRDRVEMELIQFAYAARIPIFTVCRGTQVANVAFGGSLIEDIRTRLGSSYTIHHQQQVELGKPWDAYTHDVIIDTSSTLHAILGGRTRIQVNSTHHQAIDRPAQIFRIAGRSDDGVIEAIETPREDHPFFIGVQWHPEAFSDDILSAHIYKHFVDECTASVAS